uniref:MIT domain-containing protein n=1 Tax=Strigamia maritima TaxID=126957 RepID=T1J0J2_STRMM
MAESKEHLPNSRADDELESFRQFHDEAYLYATSAINMEEESETNGALVLYERALRLIDQALSFAIRNGETWEKVKEAQDKMRQTRTQILERLILLRTIQTSSSDLPPSYDEATSPLWSHSHPRVETGQSQSLREKVSEMSTYLSNISNIELPSTNDIPADAEAIFILEQVQLFFVSSEGYVSAPSYPTSLTVFTLVEGTKSSSNDPSGWLQVGTWIYPLIPGHSPVLQTSYGAYMFPDTRSQQPGAAVGLLIPDSVENDVRLVFENILCELTAVRREGTILSSEDVLAVEKRLSEKISGGIMKGAELLAKGVNYSASLTSKLVHNGAANLRERINPNNRPADVDPRVQKGLQYARDFTGTAVSVSSFVGVAGATMALGRYVAPHIRRQGSYLLSRALREDPSVVSSKVDDVLEVAAGSLRGFFCVKRGFVTVYISLESAARLLAFSLANETVRTVNYRYGCAVGDVTDNAVRTMGNIAMTAYNLNTVGVKSIAKRTAKSTGKALVEEFEEKKSIDDDKSRKK